MNENLAFLVDTLNAVQKIRQSTENRLIHLGKQSRSDSVVEKHHQTLQKLEDDLVESVYPVIQVHPAWVWGSKVKGVGKENLAKVVGIVEKLAGGDASVVSAIAYFDTPSKFVRFCGFAVIDGQAERRKAGQKLHYNSELRSMFWRIGASLNMARGKFYKYYLKEKEYLLARAEAQGKKVMPTPKGKFCSVCLKEVNVKTARFCPDCETKLSLKVEPEGIIFEGHLHNSALRRMLRMFIIMLYTSWREELGLAVREPYPVEHLGHSTVYHPDDFQEERKSSRSEIKCN